VKYQIYLGISEREYLKRQLKLNNNPLTAKHFRDYFSQNHIFASHKMPKGATYHRRMPHIPYERELIVVFLL